MVLSIRTPLALPICVDNKFGNSVKGVFFMARPKDGTTTEQRFWPKVNKDGPIMLGMDSPCWIWIAVVHRLGYGQFRLRGDMIQAHRASWEIHYGPIPDGLWVLHKCDNPPCVNPAHLFLGTRQDNVDDKVNKGRSYHPYGELSPAAKLTKEQAEEIRYLYAHTKVFQRELAERFGVSQTAISRIVISKTWQ